ncbi:hydroxymethylbilane synthase [Roseibacillus persicicus]|uniref:hydroxymethylbilane synthase n=1 Tax=Roseibacillus persicicus TaxID=454148 RepID=UPI00398B8800
MSTHLTLGTRGSALALCQAEMTETALAGHCDLTRQVIVTTGDKRTDVPLAAVAAASGVVDKGVFIKELEVALLDGEIDFAVHSLKDVPTILEPEFEVCAVLPRAPTGDILITRGPSLLDLPSGATIGTSSVRRKLQLLHLRPDLKVVDIRGNVPTRLQKVVDQPELDGTILAEAGLVRLGYQTQGELQTENGDTLTAHLLDRAEFLPAAGQGAVAMEILKSNETAREILAAINHEETMIRITAERHFLALLQAGCDTPVGVDSQVVDGQLRLFARVFEENGSHTEARAEGPTTQALQVAQSLFERLA